MAHAHGHATCAHFPFTHTRHWHCATAGFLSAPHSAITQTSYKQQMRERTQPCPKLRILYDEQYSCTMVQLYLLTHKLSRRTAMVSCSQCCTCTGVYSCNVTHWHSPSFTAPAPGCACPVVQRRTASSPAAHGAQERVVSANRPSGHLYRDLGGRVWASGLGGCGGWWELWAALLFTTELGDRGRARLRR